MYLPKCSCMMRMARATSCDASGTQPVELFGLFCSEFCALFHPGTLAVIRSTPGGGA